MKVLLSLSFVSILLLSCYANRKTGSTTGNHIDVVKSFYQLTEKYSQDTSMFNNTINYEKTRYVNQRNARNWNKLKLDMQSFYLDRMVAINYDILIDSLTFDTIKHYVESNTRYLDINRIHRLTQKENIYKVVDSLFISSLLENKDEKFGKKLTDDCERFRSGKFEIRVSELFTFKIDRTINTEHTYSEHDDDEWFSKIEWLSNNKYLEMVADRSWPNPNYESTYVNIYETTDTSYYYVSKSKNGNHYYEGFVVKIE